METLTEKRDALLRRRAELLEEWARTKAALLKRPEEREEDAGGESKPPSSKRMRITGILGKLDAELDRLERLIAEEAQKDPEEGPKEQAEGEIRSAAGEPPEEPEAPPKMPPSVQNRLNSVLQRLEACYPDHVVRGLVQRHRQLSEDLTAVCKQLGYESRGAFLNVCGYIYETPVGGRPAQDFQPMLDALTEKYRDREKPDTFGKLLFENPEYRGPLKTLQNKAQEVLGTTLAQHLRSIGVLAVETAGSAARQKGTPPSRASPPLPSGS